MADIASLLLDTNSLKSLPESDTPRATSPGQMSTAGDSRHGVLVYSYGVTSHEHKQATLDTFRSRADVCAPSASPRARTEDVAFYKLMAAYERNDASRKAGEAFADDYDERRRRQQQKQQKEEDTQVGDAPPAAKRRNLCNSCLRPFDDGYYSPSGGAVVEPTAEEAGNAVSFDVDLGTWKVNFTRSSGGQDAHHTGSLVGKQERTSAAPPKAAVESAESTDGGYAGYYTRLYSNSTTTLPVRTKKEEDSQVAAGDVMANYDEFLRRNHIVVMTPKPTTTTDGGKRAATTPVTAARKVVVAADVTSEYDELLRANHVVAVPAAEKKPGSATPATSLAGPSTAADAGDVMAEYAEFLRRNHVVIVTDKTEEEKVELEQKPGADVVVGEDESEDEDMEYVEVENEEYLDQLRSNHVVVSTMNEATGKEAQTKTKPVVNGQAISYEKFYEFGHHDNVGPYTTPLLRMG
jgi:hypothetical protein